MEILLKRTKINMTKESPRVSKTLYTKLKIIFSGCIAENGNSIDQKHFFLQTNEVGSGYQQNFMRKKSIYYFGNSCQVLQSLQGMQYAWGEGKIAGRILL